MSGFSIAEAAHPMTHGMYKPSSARIADLCTLNEVIETDGLFSFLPGTILTPKGEEGPRVRPLNIGYGLHFACDYPYLDPALQVEIQSSKNDEPSIVTYVVSAEAPLAIFEGDPFNATTWQELSL